MNRTTRRASLTAIGRDYYERCVQILQGLEEADEAAGAQQATPRGQLRVYCHQGIGRFVSPIVADFLTRYPEASVDLRTGHAMIDLVQEAFDLGISPFPPPDSTLVGRRLGTLTLMVCYAPAYLERELRRRPKTLSWYARMRTAVLQSCKLLRREPHGVLARAGSRRDANCPRELRYR
jgi:DNA-binding transcriptional LysR family regulator